MSAFAFIAWFVDRVLPSVAGGLFGGLLAALLLRWLDPAPALVVLVLLLFLWGAFTW